MLGVGAPGRDTTFFRAVVTATGTGLAGCTNLTAAIPTATAGGSLSTTAPTAGYVDYLDASGNRVASAGQWEYVRVWQITVPAGSTRLKQITGLTQAKHFVGNLAVPQCTVAVF